MNTDYKTSLVSFLKMYNDYENSIKEFFENFCSGLPNTLKEIEERRKGLPVKFRIMDFFSVEHYETKNSKLLWYLFNLHKEYKDENINFLKPFIEYLNEDNDWDIEYNKNIEVIRENYFNDENARGFIDLYITDNSSFAIIIENKIGAGEQEKQIEKYYNNSKKKVENVYVVYLTTSGYKPSESSINHDLLESIGNRFQTIKHGDIGLWLEGLLKEKEEFFLKDDKYKILYSAIIQIVESEKHLSNISEEDNMEQEKIKQLLEKAIKVETVEDAEEYRNLFEKATAAMHQKSKEIEFDIYYKKSMEAPIKHALKVAEICAKQNSKFKVLYDYETLKNEFYKNIEEHYTQIIKIKFNKNLKEEIWVEVGCNAYLDFRGTYFGICIQDEEVKYNKFFKRIEDKVKKEFIENSGCYSYYDELTWKIYIEFTPKDKAEDVAKKITTLYNLFSSVE